MAGGAFRGHTAVMKYLEIDRSLSGSVTLPAEAGKERQMLELVELWKPDAIRDSDGTRLSPEILGLGLPIYSTTCLVRADQDWAYARSDQLARKYLLSDPVTAIGATVSISPLAGFHPEKYALDNDSEPARWWEVVDRTSGEVVPTSAWRYDPATGAVTVEPAVPFHRYTVSFLAWITWDTTSMYNHQVNGWTGRPVRGVDPYLKPSWDHLMGWFEAYLDRLPDTEVVRLTTLAYHFVVDVDAKGCDKYRDWLGYGETVSPEALEDFAREYGYRLRPEHFVDAGGYNATYRPPTKEYRDWMDFVHRFVVRFGRELVRRVHARGKKAAIFWGDHWIGVEPYSPTFQDMGVDINIGACEDGVALRRIADSPGPQTKEIRLYPYFFPDVFREGGDPVGESRRNWAKIRRALFRRGVDRIGHGGYLGLALRFPDFIAHVGDLCAEFRMIKAQAGGSEPWSTGVRVAVLDAWGDMRAWINHTGPDQKFAVFRPDSFEVAGSNALECLSGLPVEVRFLSIAELLRSGVPADVDVLLAEGCAGTAWSGGELWRLAALAASVRAFVHGGGAFVGIGDPSACEWQGKFFQLDDVLGVQKETGTGISCPAAHATEPATHFITADLGRAPDVGTRKSWVFRHDRGTEVLAAWENHVHLAVNRYGNGRAVYLAGLPYSPDNSRLLLRALVWAAQRESALEPWSADSPGCDVVAWPESGVWAAANSTDSPLRTWVRLGDGRTTEIELPAYGIGFWTS